MKQIIILLVIVLLNGCCWNGPNMGMLGSGRTIDKVNTLTLAVSKINPSAKAIEVGMSKEQVLEAWGKADWHGAGEDNEWLYSNVKESKIQHPVTYNISFENDKVKTITESIFSKQKIMCTTIDL